MSEVVTAFLDKGALGLVALVAIGGCVWLVRLYHAAQQSRVADMKALAEAAMGFADRQLAVATKQTQATEAHNGLLSSMRDECRTATKAVADDVKRLLDQHMKGGR